MAFEITLDLSDTLVRLYPRRMQLTTPSGIWSLGLLFNLRAGQWLTRKDGVTGLWILSVFRVDNVALLRSKAVTRADDLLRLHRPANPDLPPGVLSCEGPRDPGKTDLGDGTCKLVYREE